MLTGNRRCQQQDDGKLILQVEYSYFDGKAWRCEWRDATPADVPDLLKGST